jgi:hypothetical protein
MADYVLPAVVEKRVRYFDGQFLQDQDFIDEQDYQLDREHRINRLLHGPGVAEGLGVTSGSPNQVTVAAGTAIDASGWQLALAQATNVDLPAATFNNKQGVQLYLSYLVSAEDPQTVAGSSDFTRWLERPALTALAPGSQWQGTSPPVLLATLSVDGAGRVTIDSTVRSYSGVLLPGPGTDPAALQATSAGTVRIDGPLTVSAPPSGSAFSALQIDAQSFANAPNLTASYYLNMRDVGAGAGGANRFCVRGDGFVGINTGTPQARLEVVGGGGANIDLLVNGRLKSNSNDGGLWVSVDRFIGGVGSNVGFFTGGQWQFQVMPNGNVGIGSGLGSPSARLEVAGGGGSSIDLLVNGRIRSNNNDGGLWVSTDRFVGGFGNTVGFWNGSAWRLTVAPNGNVGVGLGTATPASPLHVLAPASGSPFTALQIDVQSFSTGANSAASYFLNMRDVGGGAAGANKFCVRGDGNVGVGTGTPGARLEVVGGGGTNIDLLVNGRMKSNNNDGGLWVSADRFVGGFGTNIGFWSNGAWRLAVLNDGTVGIGTATTNGLTLSVNGSTYLQGDTYIGGHFVIQMGANSGRWADFGGQTTGIGGGGPLWAFFNNTNGPSDLRLKTDLRPVSDAMCLVRRLQAVRYRWGEEGLRYFTSDIEDTVCAGPGATPAEHAAARQEERDEALAALDGDRLGLVAQDVEAVLPELVHEVGGYKHIRYQHLTALLAEALKELSAEVAELRAAIGASS